VALDLEHRLVLAVVPGARTIENTEAVIHEIKNRLHDRTPELITTDDYGADESALVQVFGVPVDPPTRNGSGRPRILPRREVPNPSCADSGGFYPKTGINSPDFLVFS
jgi:hypothetical protein